MLLRLEETGASTSQRSDCQVVTRCCEESVVTMRREMKDIPLGLCPLEALATTIERLVRAAMVQEALEDLSSSTGTLLLAKGAVLRSE
jgi:hypothetical protein